MIYLLACYGLTFALCDAKLFSRPRTWVKEKCSFVEELLSCYFCTGFWSSIVVYASMYYDGFTVDNWQRSLISTVASSFAGAAFSYALNAAIIWMEMAIHNREEGDLG